jgi:hypothetical protein
MPTPVGSADPSQFICALKTNSLSASVDHEIQLRSCTVVDGVTSRVTVLVQPGVYFCGGDTSGSGKASYAAGFGRRRARMRDADRGRDPDAAMLR